MEKRSNLEVLSWIAGIVGALFTIYAASKPLFDTTQSSEILTTVKPSFDCSIKALNKIELLICNSNDLALLDLTMANAYRDLQAETRAVEKIADLKLDQNTWLKNIRNSCEHIQCLKDAYSKRVKTLQSLRS